jgi:hypothetical protein
MVPSSAGLRVRAHALALGLVLAGSWLAAVGLADNHNPLQCGELAPTKNSCVDCCLELSVPAAPLASAAMLGYVGQVQVYLNDTVTQGGRAWSCAALVADQVPATPWTPAIELTANCAGPYVFGADIGLGDALLMTCLAAPVEPAGQSLVGVGPDGPWGCSVNVGSASPPGSYK